MAKKILLINGGGQFGLIPAILLSWVYDTNKQDFRECIDCLSGSSIGGILTAMYAAGNDPQTIANAFAPACRKIFNKRFIAKINPLASPRYDDDQLESFIKSYVKDKTVGDIHKKYPKLDVFFAGLDVTDDSYKVWDNITGKDDRERLSDICRITCAAPTYFDAVNRGNHAMVDCGLIENTMLMTTTIGYKNRRNVPFEEMDVLLIGSGYLMDKEPLDYKKYSSMNQLEMLFNLIIPYVTQSNELASIYWARGLGLRNFYYFNPVAIYGEMDDTSLLPRVGDDAMMWGLRFMETWNSFLSDEKKDPVKDVRELIVLPPEIGEKYYIKVC
jgi:hypothetical protein